MARLRAAFIAAALLWAAPAAADPVDRWSAYIGEASGRFGVPEAWIRRVMGVESGGRTLLNGRPIVSRAGAMGLMQLMPGTWQEMRASLGLGTDPYDPRDNILAGAAYLRAMYDRFGYPGLFAAYNAGPARYAAWLTAGRRLPFETVAYVATVAGRHTVESATLPRAPQPALFAVRAASPQPGTTFAEARDGLFVRLDGQPR
ncbi:MAG TPA: lytic transglycosylase domain-containing protein [Allosphingosinicella sp.]|nr:lytic transglycosylase domain-containing protein [Allosphingosinicella sp.]